MNSDEIMSDPAGPSNETPGAAAWNTKKFREEYEACKNRLQDQKFSVGEFRLYLLSPTQPTTNYHVNTTSPKTQPTTPTRLHRELPIPSSTPRVPGLRWSSSFRNSLPRSGRSTLLRDPLALEG